MLQIPSNIENERFECKHAANTIEMAASSSKMLQIARKMNRTGNPKEPTRKKTKQEKPMNPNAAT